jgi:hypothetical protein
MMKRACRQWAGAASFFGEGDGSPYRTRLKSHLLWNKLWNSQTPSFFSTIFAHPIER